MTAFAATMPETPGRDPHPEDAREALRAHAERRRAHEAEGEAIINEAPTVFAYALRAGLRKQEIADLAGVHRETLRRINQTTSTKGA